MPSMVITYLRVSSEEQAQKDLSIPAQRKALQRWIADQADVHHLAEFVDEGKSAYAPANRRPGFTDMIKYCSSRQVDQILVHKLDRFSRNREEAVIFKSLLRSKGVVVRSISETHDPDTPQGFLYEGIMEVLSQYYSMNLATETLKGMKENAERGYHNGGAVPYGYRVSNQERPDGRPHLVPGPAEEVAVVQEIYQLATIERWGVTRITEHLNTRGVPAPRTRHWSRATVGAILRNPVYCGETVWRRTKRVERRRQVATSPDERIHFRDSHPAIVQRDLWERRQELAGERRFSAKKVASASYLLTGVIRCARCGGPYVGRMQKYRTIGGERVRYDYQCATYLSKSKAVCSARPVAADWIEDVVIAEIRQRLCSEGRLELLEAAIRARLATRNRHEADGARQLRRQLQEIDLKIEKYYRAIGEGLDPARCRAFIDELSQRRLEVLDQIEHLKSDTEVSAIIDRNLAALKQLRTALLGDLRQMSAQVQRAIVHKLVESVIVGDDDVEITIRLPLSSEGEAVVGMATDDAQTIQTGSIWEPYLIM